MLLDEEKQSRNDVKIVVRLLSGLLRGCEFTLHESNTLFLVADDKTLSEQHKGTLLPDNTIYIPAQQAGNSFEITVTQNENGEVWLRELNNDSPLRRLIDPNTFILVGELAFAWRHEHEAFSPEILHGKLDIKPQDDQEIAPRKMPMAKGRWGKVLLAVAIVGALSASGYGYLTGTQRQINTVATLLNFAPDDYRIIYGRDSWIYVFAQSDKSADWAIQTIIRNPPRQQVNVMSRPVEEARIGRWIETQWPLIKFHQIRLDNPERPTVRISSQRAGFSEQQRSHFIAGLKKAFPYADDIILDHLDDKTVRTLAQQGLQKMALSFREIDNRDSVTFVITGVIEDGMLENIKNFVNQFYQQWGGEYVHFSLELKTDWFKDKSFKFGDQGYIKLGAGHWFFPKNTIKEQ